MRYSFILIALLSACAADRSVAPVIMHSSKPAEVVADCIQGKWMATVPTYSTMKARHGEGFTVQLTADGVGAMVMADAMPDGSGSVVNFRPWVAGDWGLLDETRACM